MSISRKCPIAADDAHDPDDATGFSFAREQAKARFLLLREIVGGTRSEPSYEKHVTPW